MCGSRHAWYAFYQDKDFSDSLPACKASDVFALFIPDFASAYELVHIALNLSHLFF